MSFLIAAGAIAAAVFVFSYIRSGRFGATIVAIGIGYLLAMMWTEILVSYSTISLPYVTRYDTIYSALILMAGILALLFSPRQKSILPKIIAALLVASLSVVLLLPVLEPWSKESALYEAIYNYQGV